MKLDNLVAIDTHVHIEPDPTGNAAEEAARKYLGIPASAMAARNWPSITGRGRSAVWFFPLTSG